MWNNCFWSVYCLCCFCCCNFYWSGCEWFGKFIDYSVCGIEKVCCGWFEVFVQCVGFFYACVSCFVVVCDGCVGAEWSFLGWVPLVFSIRHGIFLVSPVGFWVLLPFFLSSWMKCVNCWLNVNYEGFLLLSVIMLLLFVRWCFWEVESRWILLFLWICFHGLMWVLRLWCGLLSGGLRLEGFFEYVSYLLCFGASWFFCSWLRYWGFCCVLYLF